MPVLKGVDRSVGGEPLFRDALAVFGLTQEQLKNLPSRPILRSNDLQVTYRWLFYKLCYAFAERLPLRRQKRGERPVKKIPKNTPLEQPWMTFAMVRPTFVSEIGDKNPNQELWQVLYMAVFDAWHMYQNMRRPAGADRGGARRRPLPRAADAPPPAGSGAAVRPEQAHDP